MRTPNDMKEVCLGILLVFVMICLTISVIRTKNDDYEANHEQSTPMKSRSANNESQQDHQPPIRILCVVLTTPGNAAKIMAVEQTWAKRCDKFLKIKLGSKLAETEDSFLDVPLARESRSELWHKVIATFSYLYRNKLNNYDWFLKADDDSYFLMDNLRHFLAAGNTTSPNEPIYFGHKFKPFVKQGYMSGGSGYVLSREALRRLYRDGFKPNLTACDMLAGQVEDVEMGKCLEAVQVKAGDTRDALGRETFLPLSPKYLLAEHDPSFWYWNYNYYNEEQSTTEERNQTQQIEVGDRSPRVGSNQTAPTLTVPFKNCCSNKPISFHYIAPSEMYLIDWLLYDVELRPARRPENERINSRQKF